MIALLLPLLAPGTARASDFVDVWVTSAFEDTNVRAGPDGYSPAANFVERGNRTFFEDYESRTTDDITRAELVLYRADDGFKKGWSTEAAFVLRYTPYLDPDNTDPGTQIEDDGSYVRIIRALPGEDHTLSLTGYAVDAGRFRLGYSYDLTWGGRDIYSFSPGAAPGVRLQWQRGGSYAFLGAKTAVGDQVQIEDDRKYNQAFYGFLSGAGVMIADRLKLEGAFGSFQQGQMLNVADTSSPLYGEMIVAAGYAAQVAWRNRGDMRFIESADLRLYRNGPDFVKETYISHDVIDGFGMLVQAEVDRLCHNLLDPDGEDQTVVECGTAGDVQSVLQLGATRVGADLVYKDLPYILFNVPGLTSGVALSPNLSITPQLYGRLKLSHYFEAARLAPTVGVGLMQPATYTYEGDTYVQYTERDKEAVPDGQAAAAILGGIAGAQVDVSPSVVAVAELLFTIDNNLSDFQYTDEEGTTYARVPSPENERNAVGFNVMMRARF